MMAEGVRRRVVEEAAGVAAREETDCGGDFEAGLAQCLIASFIVSAQRCDSLLFLLRVFVGERSISRWSARESIRVEAGVASSPFKKYVGYSIVPKMNIFSKDRKGFSVCRKIRDLLESHEDRENRSACVYTLLRVSLTRNTRVDEELVRYWIERVLQVR